MELNTGDSLKDALLLTIKGFRKYLRMRYNLRSRQQRQVVPPPHLFYCLPLQGCISKQEMSQQTTPRPSQRNISIPVGESRGRESPRKDCRCTQRVTPDEDQSSSKSKLVVQRNKEHWKQDHDRQAVGCTPGHPTSGIFPCFEAEHQQPVQERRGGELSRSRSLQFHQKDIFHFLHNPPLTQLV